MEYIDAAVRLGIPRNLVLLIGAVTFFGLYCFIVYLFMKILRRMDLIEWGGDVHKRIRRANEERRVHADKSSERGS